jgi:hypothetical protein
LYFALGEVVRFTTKKARHAALDLRWKIGDFKKDRGGWALPFEGVGFGSERGFSSGEAKGVDLWYMTAGRIPKETRLWPKASSGIFHFA